MLPLDGITVVAVEQAVAAPFATRQLADLGARIIKIERPGVGDFARGYDTTVNGMSSHFVWLNRSKQSLTLDLKQPEAVDVLRRLLGRADVFIHNLAPGAMARLGFASADVRRAHPRLVVCEISGYGSDGPYRDKKAYDLLVQAEAGLLAITGNDEQAFHANDVYNKTANNNSKRESPESGCGDRTQLLGVKTELYPESVQNTGPYPERKRCHQ